VLKKTPGLGMLPHNTAVLPMKIKCDQFRVRIFVHDDFSHYGNILSLSLTLNAESGTEAYRVKETKRAKTWA
jgi:hypothetical protein